jgi:hypothetical protein
MACSYAIALSKLNVVPRQLLCIGIFTGTVLEIWPEIDHRLLQLCFFLYVIAT